MWNEIAAPFESALSRVGLAQASRAEGEEERAVLEFRAAQSTFERIGAIQFANRAARACGEVARDEFGRRTRKTHSSHASGAAFGEGDSAPAPSVFTREGDYWSIVFEGRMIRLRDLKGMRYLSRLLAHPRREFHVMDLVVGETSAPSRTVFPEMGLRSSIPGDAGEMLDARAKEAYRRRLAEIDEDIAEAREAGDAERAARADAERDFLVRELSRAVGLGGRDRRADSASERARASVTQAVRHAMARIRQHNPDLGDHLDSTVRTGTYCVYLPDPRVPAAWEV